MPSWSLISDGWTSCKASCVDWYGNARRLFLRGRVFALMGYELVEGQLVDGHLATLRRVSFAPRLVRGGDALTGVPACANRPTMRY